MASEAEGLAKKHSSVHQDHAKNVEALSALQEQHEQLRKTHNRSMAEMEGLRYSEAALQEASAAAEVRTVPKPL